MYLTAGKSMQGIWARRLIERDLRGAIHSACLRLLKIGPGKAFLGEFNDSFHALPGLKSAPQQKIRLIFALSLFGQAWLDR
jgi:hypothetical protein